MLSLDCLLDFATWAPRAVDPARGLHVRRGVHSTFYVLRGRVREKRPAAVREIVSDIKMSHAHLQSRFSSL